MRFTLYYRGPLKANGERKHKHDLRREFHRQLSTLYRQGPLRDLFQAFQRNRLEAEEEGDFRKIGPFTFAPLVNSHYHMMAELELTMLRPDTPGQIITQGGDIDNRLKTLFDSLKMPAEPNALPNAAKPEQGEDPFFCLLEDDSLVTQLSVRTDQLLGPSENQSEVVLLIGVTVRASFTWIHP